MGLYLLTWVSERTEFWEPYKKLSGAPPPPQVPIPELSHDSETLFVKWLHRARVLPRGSPEPRGMVAFRVVGRWELLSLFSKRNMK